MTVLAGHYAGPAGSANRIGAKTICQTYAFTSETVDIARRRHASQMPTVRTDGVTGMIVGHNKQYVRSVFVGLPIQTARR